MTVKMPAALQRGVEEEARRRGVPKSVLVRECLEAMLRRKPRQKPPSCLELVADLAGSQPGPPDASVNRCYMADACLVRMAELSPRCRVLTTDSHFRIYKKKA